MGVGKRDFDVLAEHWDDNPRRLQLADDVAAAILREVPVTAKMSALDFGCGTGLLTLRLQPHVARIAGVDTSAGMIAVLGRKAAALPPETVTARVIAGPEEEQGEYDLVVSSMTLHHVEEVPALVAALAGRLRPGGWMALADLETEDGSFHDDPAGVCHHGFSRDRLAAIVAGAALETVRAVPAAVIRKGSGESARCYPVILGVGRKPLP